MPNKQAEIVNLDLHEQARNQVISYVNDFGITLLLSAKTIAYQSSADLVLRKHVEDALEQIYSEKKKSWSRELLIVVGGAFFGAFIQGFISELSNGNATLIAIYTIMGFLGISLVFLGFRK